MSNFEAHEALGYEPELEHDFATDEPAAALSIVGIQSAVEATPEMVKTKHFNRPSYIREHPELPEDVKNPVYKTDKDRFVLHDMVKHFKDDPEIVSRLTLWRKKGAKTEAHLSDDEFGDFISEAAKMRLLTQFDEYKLTKTMKNGVAAFKHVQNGDESEALLKLAKEGTLAYNVIFNANLLLPVKFAYKASEEYPQLDPSDLLNSAYLGLQSAIQMFDEEKKFKFSTYSTNWVKQAVKREIANNGRTIRLPVHKDEEYRNLSKLSHEIFQATGEMPTSEELATETGQSVDEIDFLLERGKPSLPSLNAPLNESGTEMGDVIAQSKSDEPEVESIYAAEELKSIIENANLSLEEKAIISLRYGITMDELEGKKFVAAGKYISYSEAVKKLRAGNSGETYMDVSRATGANRNSIRDIETEALDKMRRAA